MKKKKITSRKTATGKRTVSHHHKHPVMVALHKVAVFLGLMA